MLGFPPLPPYDGLHVIVVHLPLGILSIAWMPMVAGLIDKKRRSGWMASAALLLIVGTAFAFFATITGEAAEEIVVDTTQQMHDAIHEHEEIAELARNLFIVVSVLFIAVCIAAAKVAEKKKPAARFIGGILVAVTYFFAFRALVNAGHLGGLLVHKYGIHAPMDTASQNPTPGLGQSHGEKEN